VHHIAAVVAVSVAAATSAAALVIAAHGLAHCVAASCLLYATFRPLRQPIRCPTVTVAVAIVVTAASIAILVTVAVSMWAILVHGVD